jgi:hypothetical protein
VLTVEHVRRADQRRRWHELPRVLFAQEPRYAPALIGYERWLFSRRHPWLRAGHAVERYLVRRSGNVIGRIAVHDGGFGGFECADDVDAVRALVDESGATAGPVLYTPADGDAGVLVSGFEHRGGTGRPWHPPWYAAHLAACGFEPVGAPMPRWRRPTGGVPVPSVPGRRPPHAGRLGDPDLAISLPEGEIAAVPDVSGLARHPTEAAVVRCDGEPAVLVPALLAVATRYAAVWAPAGDGPPDTVHQLLARTER